jgi:hypothetical protein
MLQYSPKIVTDSLVMCLDASQNKSYPTTDLPVKDQLNLWLDAADDTTFSYSSGTTVSQWRDKSGQNNHAIVMGGSPLRSVAINSRKAVSFTSTTSFKCVTGAFISTATHIVVCRATTSSATYQRVYNGGGNSDLYVFIGALANNIATFWGNGSSWNDVNANSPSITILNTLRIISAVNTGAGATPYYDGTAMTVKATNPAAYTGYELNTYATGNLQPLVGEVCEIIVFNKQLSTTELKQVHTYLGQKWGISNTDRSIVDLAGNDDNGLFGNGTVANMPVYDFYNNGTLRFDGVNDYIFLNNSQLNIASSITVEAWVKYNAQGGYNARAYSVITCKGYPWTWLLEDQSGQFNFRISTSVTADSNVNSSYSHGLNTWNHVVGTYDGTSQKIYVDGILRSSTSLSGTINVSSNDALVGIYNYGDYCLTGNVGVVRVYQKALSAAEVAQNYEAQKSKFANTIVQQGLVLNLDAGNPYSYAGAGSTWYDVSGNSFNATLINSPTYISDNGGVLNWASANSQYATVPMSSTLRVASITQEVWVYLSSTADQVFIGSQYGTSSNNSFALWIQSGTFYFGVNTGGTFYTSTSSAASTSTWYHLVHTYNATTQYLYINGVLTTTFNSAASGNISYDTSNTLLAIGADFNGTGYNVGPSVYTNGKMPVVRIYNIALSAAQVLQNYNATKGRFGL